MNRIDPRAGLPIAAMMAMLLGGLNAAAGQDAAGTPQDQPSRDVQATIVTPTADCIADRPAVFQVKVVNAGQRASADKLELLISYGTVNKVEPTAGRGRSGRAAADNPVRETKIILPALAPNETRTIPVTLTPRRIGEFRLLIRNGDQFLASGGVDVRFDPSTPAADLLPKFTVTAVKGLPRTLADVPEVGLEDRISKTMSADEAFEHLAHMKDKILYVNSKKTDAFIVAMLEKRPDITGMPMAMGDSCRLKPERAAHFSTAVRSVRQAMSSGARGDTIVNFLSSGAGVPGPQFISAQVAAMMQVVAPESIPMRQSMVSNLSSLRGTEATKNSTADATMALANVAIFSPDEQVRQSALEALSKNPIAANGAKDFDAVLARGLNYPWPAVAQNAADAIVKLKRRDLLPELVAVLERPDARAPQTSSEGKQMVREVVRVNHLRNCLLCHAPGSPDQNEGSDIEGRSAQPLLLARVPVPNQPLPANTGSVEYYDQFASSDVLVRFDVTYLRQDFTVVLPVADHQPWPQTQRYDYLVRSRTVSDQEAVALATELRSADKLSPYQQAALSALRGLTGRDAAPTAAAWNEILQQLE